MIKKLHLYRSHTRILATVALAIFMLTPGWGQTYTKITSLAELTDGYYIVAYGTTFAMNSTNAGTYFTHTAITPSGNNIIAPAAAIIWKIQTHLDGGRTIYSENTSMYVSYTGSSNTAYAVASVTGGSERWTFAWTGSLFTITNVTSTTRLLKYNTSTPRFSCYTSGQQNITLYKLATTPEMDVQGNSTSIADGDAIPSVSDWTDFGSVLSSSGTISKTYTIYHYYPTN